MDAGPEISHRGGGGGLRRRGICPQRRVLKRPCPAPGHGLCLRAARMAGGGGSPGGHGGLHHLLGPGRFTGHRLGSGGAAAGAASGKQAGTGRPATTASRGSHGGGGHGGGLLPAFYEGRNAVFYLSHADSPGSGGHGALRPGPEKAGCLHRVDPWGGGNPGPGPGGAHPFSVPGLRGRRGDRHGQSLPRGSPGGAGAGSGPGDEGAHDGGAVPFLFSAAASLPKKMGPVSVTGGGGACDHGGLRHLGPGPPAGAVSGRRSGVSAAAPAGGGPPPGRDGDSAGAAGAGGGNAGPGPAAASGNSPRAH